MDKANIIITHKCNLMCKHCYMNAQNGDFEDCQLLFKNFKNSISLLKKLGVNEVMLTGGECTISPILFKILDYCQKENVKVSIFTNGVIFNKKIIKYVDSYSISLDGLKDNHNKLRGNSNAYDNTIKTIKYLTKNNKKVTIQVTITKLNMSEILDIIDLVYSLNIKEVNLCCLLDEGRSLDNNLDSNIDLKKLKEIINIAYKKTGFNVKIHTNIFNKFDTNYYLKTQSIIFPLWIDLVDSSFYLIKENSAFSKNLIDLSESNIKSLTESLNSFISKNMDSWGEKDYYILENEILKQLSGGDENE